MHDIRCSRLGTELEYGGEECPYDFLRGVDSKGPRLLEWCEKAAKEKSKMLQPMHAQNAIVSNLYNSMPPACARGLAVWQ